MRKYYGNNLKLFSKNEKNRSLHNESKCTCSCDCSQYYKTINKLNDEYSNGNSLNTSAKQTESKTQSSINKSIEIIENVYKITNRVENHWIENNEKESPLKRVLNNVSEVFKCTCDQTSHTTRPSTNRKDFIPNRGVSPNVIRNSNKNDSKNYRNVSIDRSINKCREDCIHCTCNKNIKLVETILTDSLQNTFSDTSSPLSEFSDDYFIDEVSLKLYQEIVLSI